MNGFAHRSSTREQIAVLYAQSWSLVHFLMLGQEGGYGRARVDRYVALVDGDADPLQAFEEVFGSVGDVEAALADYVRRTMFPAMRLDAPEPPDDPFDVRVLSESESSAAIGDFLIAGDVPANAIPFLERALELDAQSSLAMESLAYVHLRTGNRAAARTWLDRAAEGSASSYLLHYFRALLLDSPAETSAHRESLRRTIELNAKFTPAYVALSESYAQDPASLDDARELALEATALEPTAVYTWINLAQVLLRLDETEPARDALEQALRLAGSEEEKQAIRSMLPSP